ncbi:MAG TPA: XTP/dITP diphosphatase [Nitrososphaera sp.]|nr:XTP/dITP diphosphatase [Nitrososphaera sp.]
MVTFASTNQNKFKEVQSILKACSISVDFAQVNPVEIQSDSLEEIAREKAKSAFSHVGRPVIVEDDGLFIDVLKGFPGQYSSYVFKTIGNRGIMKLLDGEPDRRASFRSLIAFYDGSDLSISEGRVDGRISEKIAEGGWGYDPIFIPAGSDLTFAELKEKKNDYSHRRAALEKFALWYKQRTRDSGL